MPEGQAVEENLAEQLAVYRRTEDIELRNQILMACLYIPRVVASQLRGVISGSVQEEDLVNQGVITLMECMERYDPSKGAKFETYAFLRVRGAMIDYIRKQDFIPHRMRRLGKEIEQAYAAVANEKMREPEMDELAEYIGIPKERLDENIRAINSSVMLSFETVLQDVSQYAAREGLVSRDTDGRPEEQYVETEAKRVLAEAIEGLPEKERLVVTLYYYEELKYMQIAEVIGVGESRVCQIHTKAILHLKNKLEAYMKG